MTSSLARGRILADGTISPGAVGIASVVVNIPGADYTVTFQPIGGGAYPLDLTNCIINGWEAAGVPVLPLVQPTGTPGQFRVSFATSSLILSPSVFFSTDAPNVQAAPGTFVQAGDTRAYAGGTFDIQWYLEVIGGSVGDTFRGRIEVDGTTQGEFFAIAGQVNDQIAMGGLVRALFSAAAHTIALEFDYVAGAGPVTGQRGRVLVTRAATGAGSAGVLAPGAVDSFSVILDRTAVPGVG